MKTGNARKNEQKESDDFVSDEMKETNGKKVPNQKKAVIKDRLICGDVGYGKTEIAIRAAFKAVKKANRLSIWYQPQFLHNSITIRLHNV